MIATTNLYALEFWTAAHIAAGDGMLAPCGMTVNDIDAVLTVSPEQRRKWAATGQQALIVPRPGLLPLLADDDELQIRRRIRPWRTVGLDQLLEALNRQLLAAWQATKADPALCARLSLGEGDCSAVCRASVAQLDSWCRLGVALGVPQPELLPRLFDEAEPTFSAFMRSLSA